MANKLKGLRVTSTDLVDNPANPDSRVRLFKRRGAGGADYADGGGAGCADGADGADGGGGGGNGGNGGGEDGIIQKIASALASAIGKGVKKEAKTFGDEVARDKLHEITSQSWDFCYALSDSLSSIIYDGEITGEDKKNLIFTSLDEFAEVIRNAAMEWAAGKKYDIGKEAVAKSAAQQAALDELVEKYAKGEGAAQGAAPGGAGSGGAGTAGGTYGTAGGGAGNNTGADGGSAGGHGGPGGNKEGMDTMKLDTARMTADEKAVLAGFEKKYGVPDGGQQGDGDGSGAGADDGGAGTGTGTGTGAGTGVGTGAGNENGGAAQTPAPEGAGEVLKSQAAKIEALEKKLALAELENFAKKYEAIGKKAADLAPKLYEMKKAGGTAYADYTALLDEQAALVENSGLFKEIGKSTSGAPGSAMDLVAKAEEIRKNNPGMGRPEAMAKAYEENPGLAAAYDEAYMAGGDY